ncbi:MAG: HAD-IA family hydrolase [Bacteroidota bacterium]|nr:HAD-IA family hydrolase [Bacteroidota bacterium]
MLRAVFFDLDGVLCNISQFHYLSWKSIAQKFKFDLSLKKNEKLKGLNRKESLNKILSWADVQLAEARKEELIKEKNNHYLRLIDSMAPEDLHNGALMLFQNLRENSVKIGLGASTNHAIRVLDKLDCITEFDAIVDGNMVSNPKPHGEVYELLLQKLQLTANECIVIEDSLKGIESSRRAKIQCIVVGDIRSENSKTNVHSLEELNFKTISKLLS